jgi:uncharacterized membrane protein
MTIKNNMQILVLIFTAMTTALIGGLFYAYSCSVNPGLGRLNDVQYMAAMQSINRAIINPLFMMSFMGTLLLLPICTWLNYSSSPSDRFYLLLAATVIYVVGTFGVTVAGNVPLNDALDKVNLQSGSLEYIREQRLLFEEPWNKLHRVRSIASVLTIFCVVAACVFDKNQLRSFWE